MRLFHGTDNADIARPTVLTLGVFDGLHLGHQLIMQTVVARARAVQVQADKTLTINTRLVALKSMGQLELDIAAAEVQKAKADVAAPGSEAPNFSRSIHSHG